MYHPSQTSRPAAPPAPPSSRRHRGMQEEPYYYAQEASSSPGPPRRRSNNGGENRAAATTTPTTTATTATTATPSYGGWVDFSSTFTAFGTTATSWFESYLDDQGQAPSAAQQATAQATAARTTATAATTPRLQGHPSTDLAMTRQAALSTAPTKFLVRTQTSKLSDRTFTSDETSSSASSVCDEPENIWDAKNGDHHDRHESSSSLCYYYLSLVFCSCFQFQNNNNSKTWKFQCGVWTLILLIILACSILIGLGSTKQNSDNALQNQDIEKLLQGDYTTFRPTMSPSAAAPTTVAPTISVGPTTSMGPTTSFQPTDTTSPTLTQATYIPGKLTHKQNGLILSQGLSSRIVARTGQQVELFSPTGSNTFLSQRNFHDEPDGAAVLDWHETGGWIYVSNAEVKNQKGGVGAIYFDANGNVVDYQRLLEGTTMNCSGGKTPWNTWISCEETSGGRVYQVDPFGVRDTEPISMIDTGYFEAFAHDMRNELKPRFFVTEDKKQGPLRRLTPTFVTVDDPWDMLHGPGTLEYLVLHPNNSTYEWTMDKQWARDNSELYYQHSEGIDVYQNELFFTTKNQKELFVLNLDDMTYESTSTVSGVFDGMPDQVKRLVGDDGNNSLLYFCEEGGVENGVHARDENGWFFTILESDTFNDETTGLDFSPNGKHMYVSFQHNGIIFDIYRDDGLPFHGKTLNVKYHETTIE